MSLKPIETKYKGYRFRSRLEARWAVFFDALGIAWEYEKEGFDLGEAGWYLPDFWLPTFCGGMFAEVKDMGDDFSKAKALCIASEKAVWLCEGVPSARAYTVLGFSSESGVFDGEGVPNYDQAFGENRMFWSPGWSGVELPQDEYSIAEECGLLLAVAKARSARFEHGETPETVSSSIHPLPHVDEIAPPITPERECPRLTFSEKGIFIDGEEYPLFRTITSLEQLRDRQRKKLKSD